MNSILSSKMSSSVYWEVGWVVSRVLCLPYVTCCLRNEPYSAQLHLSYIQLRLRFHYSNSVWLARKRASVAIHFLVNVSVMTSLSVWMILASLTDYTYTDRKVCSLSGSPLATAITCTVFLFAGSVSGWFGNVSERYLTVEEIRCACFDDSGPRRVFLSLALVCLGEIPGWSCQ